MSPPLAEYGFDPLREDGSGSTPWFVLEIPGDDPPKFSRKRLVLPDGSRLTAYDAFRRFAPGWLVEPAAEV